MALTRLQYLRIATGLPIVLPLPFIVALALLDPADVHLPKWIGAPIALAFSALFLFGPVYVVLVAMILLVLRNRSWRAHAVAALVAPLLMIVCAGFLYSIGDREVTIWAGVRLWAADCLKVGYTYVAVSFAGMILLQRTGGVRD